MNIEARVFFPCMLVVLILAVIGYASCARAGEIAYDLSPPTTSDSASCGAMDAPLTDFDHYKVALYRCRTDSLVHRPPPLKPLWIARRDSVVFTVSSNEFSIPESLGGVGWLQVWSVDRSGNKSCVYLSDAFASPAAQVPPPPPPADTTTGIAPRYYIGTSRGGQATIGPRGAIDFAWGLGSPFPGIPADQWSAEWIGKIVIPTSGAYTFYLKSEDGGQLFVAGTLLINRYGIQPLTEWSAPITLMAGEHNIHVTYMANNGNSECHLSWGGPNLPKSIVPRSALK